MPPPTTQELAAAHIQQSLNQGAFEHTYEPSGHYLAMPPPGPGIGLQYYGGGPHNSQPAPVPAPSQSGARASHSTPHDLGGGSFRLEVEIPAAPVTETKSTLATAATPIRFEFSINDVLPGDFLARVCANMDVSRADAKLGWKASTVTKRSLARPLYNDNDVKAAFDYFCPIIASTRRTKKVHMLVVNLAKPAEKVIAAPKVTETAYCDELNIVKGALACEKHSGRNRWCFVRRDAEKGEHCVPLGLEEITLWARKLHEDKAKAPEELASQREERNKTRKRNNAPDIHVHMPPMPVFADVLNRGPPNDHHGKRHHDQLSGDDEKMPDLNYPQYEGALRKQGVVYAKNIDPSDHHFLVKDIGMAKVQ
ncbi:hypothetical protein B0H19DRAFT_1258542 [Mycena capillaripes]|nr:hypothetical protein B0H19DRAFT_1258542 [Mycena capillaripes]